MVYGQKNGAGKQWDKHSSYNGEAFAKFLQDEKQYAAEKTGLHITMGQITDAFARSALDFFIYKCDWSTMSPQHEGINIRRSLTPWVNNLLIRPASQLV